MCNKETRRIGKNVGGHITNTIFTKKRIFRNSQNPVKGVGYLKEGERISLGPLVVGYVITTTTTTTTVITTTTTT